MRAGGAPQAPQQTIVFAVGDVHGRLDLLERLTEQLAVETEADARDGKSVVAVFLGDYIDRGPDSAGVIDHLIRFRGQAECRTVFLRGNHEDVLLSLLDGHEDSTRWLEYGGVETLRSYGVSLRGELANPSVDKLRQAAARAIPAEHVAFLRDTELRIAFGDYIFVHAGLRPDTPLDEQTDADMMWFRDYDDEPPIWPGVVVHGHTVNPRPVRGRARIGIDTGAYATDALTALRLEAGRQDFIKVSINPDDGDVDIDVWDTVDRAFAEAETPRPRDPRRKLTPATPKRRTGALRAPAIAAGAALAAAAAAAVILYKPVAKPSSDVSPQSIAAELRGQADPGLPALPATKAAAVGGAAPAAARAGADAASTPQLRALAPSQAQDAVGPPPPLDAAPATAAPAAAAPAKPEPPGGGPRVQIAAVASTDAAEAAWTAVRQRLPGPAAGKRLEMENVQVGDQTLHRALVAGFATEDEARAFCGALRGAGRDCIVRP